jgi:predicted enzyme related to lactoylglutathione lyase
MADVHGKFVWHELMNTDPQAVAPFYNKVLGWKPQAWDKDPSYTVWMGSKGPAGGAMRHSDSSPPPHWLAYTGVPDIGAAVETAQRLGGRVIKGVADIPDGGKYAILMDPQGAQFGVFTPPANAPSGSMSSEFSWHELGTTDYAAALRFYRELFGWEQLATHDMGSGMGMYLLFGRDGQQLGGMFNRSATMPGDPSWLVYANVSNASKAADAAKASGGRVVNGPHEVPGGSWIVQMLDPLGAMIAVVEPPRSAAAKPTEKPKAAADKPKAAAPTPAAKPSAPAKSPSAPSTPKPATASSPMPAAKKAATKSPAKPAKKVVKKAAKKAAKKAVKKAAKKVAKKAKKSKVAVKRKGAISRARAAVKRVVRRVMRKKKSARGRRRR